MYNVISHLYIYYHTIVITHIKINKSTIHKCVLNAIAAPNPTLMTVMSNSGKFAKKLFVVFVYIYIYIYVYIYIYIYICKVI